MEKPREENAHYISENEVVSKPKLVFVTDEKEKGDELMNTYREVRKMFDERDRQADQDRIAQEMKEKSLKNIKTKFVAKVKKIALNNYKQVLAICVITTIASCGVYGLGHLENSNDAKALETSADKSNVEALYETHSENQITEKMIENAMLLDAGREDLIDYYAQIPENMTAEEYDAYMKAMIEKDYEKEQMLDGKAGGRK